MRYTIEELTDMADSEIGFCVDVHWRSLTGCSIPAAKVNARCPLADVPFTEDGHQTLAHDSKDLDEIAV